MLMLLLILLQVSWGAHELVLAARNLLRAAVRDPLNQKFVLLSESGIPLYPPTAVYAQLMAEDKSRIDSCGIGVRTLLSTFLDMTPMIPEPLHLLQFCFKGTEYH